jgi:hypothetical protein
MYIIGCFNNGTKEIKHNEVVLVAYKCCTEDGIVMVASHCLPACFNVVVYLCGSSDVLVLVTLLLIIG